MRLAAMIEAGRTYGLDDDETGGFEAVRDRMAELGLVYEEGLGRWRHTPTRRAAPRQRGEPCARHEVGGIVRGT